MKVVASIMVWVPWSDLVNECWGNYELRGSRSEKKWSGIGWMKRLSVLTSSLLLTNHSRPGDDRPNSSTALMQL